MGVLQLRAIWMLFIVGVSTNYLILGLPTEPIDQGETATRDHVVCAEGCRLSCRRSSSMAGNNLPPSRFCYCRCRPTAIDYGTMVYTAVVDDIWQIRCGYLNHPFVGTALAMNETGLLDEFAVTRCESDYTDECRGADIDEVCNQWWAASLCRETCSGYDYQGPPGPTSNSQITAVTTEDNLCPPDKYFRKQQPSFGNPYTACIDFHTDCADLYNRGYCQLKPTTVNCQKTCGRCISDDQYMPWNPIRSQLIQWALNRRDDGTAKILMTYFMRQYSDYISEVHRSCREEASTMESIHRANTYGQHQHRHEGTHEEEQL